MANERELRFTVVGNIDERSLRRAETRMQKFGRNLSATTGGAALSGKGGLASSAALLRGGAIGVGLGLAGKKALEFTQAASDLNEQLSASRVVFGDSAASVEDWSKTTAEAFGIAQTQAVAASTTFGSLFAGTGQTEQNAARLSQSVVELAGDLASFKDTSVDEALNALRSGLSGEIEPLRRYQVFLTEASVAQQAMADTGKTNAKQLTQGEKILARWKLILEGTTDAQGDAARTADSYANQQRKLAAKADELEAKLGNLLLPTMTDLVSALNEGAGLALELADGLNALGQVKVPVIDIPINVVFGGSGGNLFSGLFGPTGFFGPLGPAGPLAGKVLESLRGEEKSPPSPTGPRGRGRVLPPGTRLGDPLPSEKPDRPPGDGLTRLQRLLDAADRARLNNYLSDDLRIAKELAALYESRLKGKRGDELSAALKDFRAAQLNVLGIEEEIAQNAADAAAKTKAAQDRTKAALKAAKAKRDKALKDAAKKQIEAFKDQADAIKNAVLDTFDTQTAKIDNARDLQDAKKALQVARQLGGPEAIKLAQRDLVDAQRAIQRQRLEDTAFRLTEGPKGPVNTLGVGNVTININGADDPDAIAQKVLTVLRKRSTRTAGTTSGRVPVPPGGKL